MLKAWMKRNFELAEEHLNFEAFLESAVVMNSTGQFARKHFQHAGIGIEIN